MCVHFADAGPACVPHAYLEPRPLFMQELSSTMGVLKLRDRLSDPGTQEWYDGIFPKDTQVGQCVLTFGQQVCKGRGGVCWGWGWHRLCGSRVQMTPGEAHV